VNNAFIRKSTTNYTLDSVKGSPYTLSSDGRTVEDHASIELLQRARVANGVCPIFQIMLCML
jgi:hypothetical protein